MWKLTLKLGVLAFGVLAAVSCDPTIEKENTDGIFFPGNANYTRFTALGGGQLGGMSNFELYRSGQLNSIAAILGNQFEKVGGGNFISPLMVDESGFGNRTSMQFRTDCLGETELRPLHSGLNANPLNEENIGDAEVYGNFGIPHLSINSLNTSGSRNPYYTRMKSSGANTILEDFLATPSTFFLLWLGESDLVNYALGGGGNLSFTRLPDVSEFQTALEDVIRKSTVNGQRGILVNVPDILEYPYFNTIPYDGLKLTTEEAAQLQFYYMLRGSGFEFNQGNNPYVIEVGLPLINNRQMFADELLPLFINTDSLKCESYGARLAINDEDVLTRDEIQDIRSRINGFNGAVQSMASKYGLPIFDLHEFMHDFIINGITVEGITYTSRYPDGGVFSSDGLYFTPRGNAIVANEIVKKLNSFYNSKIPLVDINSYETLPIP